MAIMPETASKQLAFCEALIAHWAALADPAAIGLAPGSVAAAEALVAACRASLGAADAAREASKAATVKFHGDAAAMRESVAALIGQVKAFAELQASPEGVYVEAQLPTRLPGAPRGAPGTPEDVRVTLEPSGAITLSWTAANASSSSGAFYNVLRRLPGESEFYSIGGAPGTTARSRTMTFTDATLPGAALASGGNATYIIRGQRGAAMGEASPGIAVNVGTTPATRTTRAATLGVARAA